MTTRQYAVIDRHGFFRDYTYVYSAHGTKAAAIKAANKHRISLPGGPVAQSTAMVIHSQNGTFAKGEKVYSDTVGRLFPVVW